MDLVPYFAYGTTQRGYTHYRRFATLLGEPVARVRTVAPHAIVVPRRAACSNPGCSYVRAPVDVVSLDGALSRTAQAYVARDGARWQALVEREEADALGAYPPELASSELQKDCCLRAPGHAPPHDVVEP